MYNLASSYPNLMRVEVIGKSYEGRDLLLAVITHTRTGSSSIKPAYWIDANTHAGEVTGSSIALFTIENLLSRYGADDRCTRLLDKYTIYVLPRLAVDGAERYLTSPYSIRSSTRRYPNVNKGEGIYPEDIDNNGYILQMRIEDPCGAWKVSSDDPRIMVLREPDEFAGTFYTIFPEGLVHDFDGYNIRNVQSLENLDFNRNYPFCCDPSDRHSEGSGSFPFSEPETRAEAIFWDSHRNINGFISYHTASAVLLRPYSSYPDYVIPRPDLEVYNHIAQRGKQLTGYDCVSVYHGFRSHPEEVVTGTMVDYSYDHYGWFGFAVELWDAPTAAGIIKDGYLQWFRSHPIEDDLALMRWNDEQLDGKAFINWQPFLHPQLGQVEIGGWDIKGYWDNAPFEYLQELCEKQFQFAIANALMSPILEIACTSFEKLGPSLYRLFVHIENQGFLPTYTSQKALARDIVPPIEVILSLPASAKLLSGKEKQFIGHLEGRSNKIFSNVASGSDYRTSVEWIIQVQEKSIVEITVWGERSGTATKQLMLSGNA